MAVFYAAILFFYCHLAHILQIFCRLLQTTYDQPSPS